MIRLVLIDEATGAAIDVKDNGTATRRRDGRQYIRVSGIWCIDGMTSMEAPSHLQTDLEHAYLAMRRAVT